MPLSIKAVREKLPVGSVFTAVNVSPKPFTSQRRVIKQNAREMVSVILDGIHRGREIFHSWAGCSAKQGNGESVVIALHSKPFLVITPTQQ